MSVYRRVPIKTIIQEKIIGKNVATDNINKVLVDNFIKSLNSMKSKIKEKTNLKFKIKEKTDMKDCFDELIMPGADYVINFINGDKDTDILFQLGFKYGSMMDKGAIIQHIYEENLPEGVEIMDIDDKIKDLIGVIFNKEEAVSENNPLESINCIINKYNIK